MIVFLFFRATFFRNMCVRFCPVLKVGRMILVHEVSDDVTQKENTVAADIRHVESNPYHVFNKGSFQI